MPSVRNGVVCFLVALCALGISECPPKDAAITTRGWEAPTGRIEKTVRVELYPEDDQPKAPDEYSYSTVLDGFGRIDTITNIEQDSLTLVWMAGGLVCQCSLKPGESLPADRADCIGNVCQEGLLLGRRLEDKPPLSLIAAVDQVPIRVKLGYSYRPAEYSPDKGWNEEAQLGYCDWPATPGHVPLYRLFRRDWRDHFYTVDKDRRDEHLESEGYEDEGIVAYVSLKERDDHVRVYEYWHRAKKDHFYTTMLDDAELGKMGWRRVHHAEPFYVAKKPIKDHTMPIYRLYNNNWVDHMYTTSWKEKEDLLAAGE